MEVYTVHVHSIATESTNVFQFKALIKGRMEKYSKKIWASKRTYMYTHYNYGNLKPCQAKYMNALSKFTTMIWLH